MELENTNQSNVEETTSEIIFDDSDTSEETIEENTEPTPEPKEEPVDKPIESFLKVKYNGAERGLTEEEAIMYAQKGMNYDKLENRYNAALNSPELLAISRQAANVGMTVQEYVKYTESFQNRSLELQAFNALKEQYPDADDELLSELARKQAQEIIAQNQAKIRASEEEQLKQEDEYLTLQIEAFGEQYPDVDMENLPQEVILEIANGESLLSAYRAYENKQLRDQLKAMQVNEKNKTKSVGNLTDTMQGEKETDLFVTGLLG